MFEERTLVHRSSYIFLLLSFSFSSDGIRSSRLQMYLRFAVPYQRYLRFFFFFFCQVNVLLRWGFIKKNERMQKETALKKINLYFTLRIHALSDVTRYSRYFTSSTPSSYASLFTANTSDMYNHTALVSPHSQSYMVWAWTGKAYITP